MTTVGIHTVAELRDLCNAKDYEIDQLGTAMSAYAPTWTQKDTQGAINWMNDWSALQKRYANARAMATQTFATVAKLGVSETTASGELQFRAIISALQKTPGIVSPGDLQDIYNRFIAAGGTVDLSGTPQPKAPDADLQLLNTLNQVPSIFGGGASGGFLGTGIPTKYIWYAAGAVLVAGVVLSVPQVLIGALVP